MRRLILSRKGFDSAAGGAASPLLEGRPIPLPIPAAGRSATRYGDLGLGDLVAAQTGGRIGAAAFCHADPAFAAGRCAFGQAGAAQSHLTNQGVGPGDMFLFFGLFAPPGGPREHRIFGWLEVAELRALGSAPDPAASPDWLPYRHPHTLGAWPANNTLYLGRGGLLARGTRLTAPDGPLTLWAVPDWMADCGLSYHGAAHRWAVPGRLRSVARGQEFVCAPGDRTAAQRWVARVIDDRAE